MIFEFFNFSHRKLLIVSAFHFGINRSNKNVGYKEKSINTYRSNIG